MAHNTKLKLIAKRLRQRMTPAEKVLWALLRDNQLGAKFRRQMPFVFGNYCYIADFYCPKHKLVIEVDGGIHRDPEISQLDNFRDEVFTEAGYRVIRFTNNEVMYNNEKLLKKIKSKINDEK